MEGQMEGVQAESDEIQAQQYQEWLDASVKAVTAPHDERIQAAESQIDELLLKYTDLHPEVMALRNTTGRLKAKREAERAAFISLQSGMVSTTENASPLYQEMRLRLSEAIAEVATQEAQVENLHERTTELQQRVDQVLHLEAEEQQLTRDNEIMGKNHSQLLTRLEKARLTREVDSSVDAVRFRTLDPPKIPRKPSGPNRIGISSAVFGGALAAGIAIALLISIMRPVFGDRRQLNEALGIPVLGSVNMIWTPKQRRRHRTVNLAFALGVLGLVGSFALVLTVFSLGIDVMSYLPV
jgi:polysaccharide chain length determinant protein (PEP-CTERM system associated)